jgi:geranylgeranylglycerol-phosphate geranylgeranyltransferase
MVSLNQKSASGGSAPIGHASSESFGGLSRKLTTFQIIIKGLSYWATSVVCLAVGYYISFQLVNEPILARKNLLLLCPVAGFFPFFVGYAFYAYKLNRQNNQWIFWISLVIPLLVAYIFYQHASSSDAVTIPGPCLYYLGFFILLFLAYGARLYYLTGKPETEYPLIHKLVWPVLLSVSVCLYFGYTFPELLYQNDVDVSFYVVKLTPPFILLLLFIALEKARIKFVLYGLLALAAWVFVIVFMSRLNIENKILSPQVYMIYFISIGAYLAYYQSWTFSYDPSYRGEHESDDLPKEDRENIGPCGKETVIGKTLKKIYPSNTLTINSNSALKTWPYYSASLMAIVIAYFLIPFVYIFTTNTWLFLVAFFLISGLGFWLWAIKGISISQLEKTTKWWQSWAAYKTYCSWLFLAVLCLDSTPTAKTIADQLSSFIAGATIDKSASDVYSKIINVSAIGALVAISTVPVKALFYEFIGHIGPNCAINWRGIFVRRRNVFRLGSAVGILFLILVFILTLFGASGHGEIKQKTLHTIIFYSILLVIIYFLEGGFKILDKIMNAPEEKMMPDSTGIMPHADCMGRLTLREKMNGFIKITRAHTCLLIALSVALPGITRGIRLAELIINAMPFFLAAMGGFAINDYYDSNKDAVDKPWRPIPSGQIRGVEAMFGGHVLLFMSVITVIIAGDSMDKIGFLLLAAFGVYFYNIVVKKAAYIKTVYTSVVCSIPLFYGIHVYNLNAINYIVPVAAVLFIIGRELLMDYLDVKGDKLGKLTTLPMIIGLAKTEKGAFGALVLSSLIILPIALYNASVGLTILSVTLFVINLGMILAWRRAGVKVRRKIINAMQVQMAMGVLYLTINV